MVEDPARTITLFWADRLGETCANCSAPIGHTIDQTAISISDGEHSVLWYSVNRTESSFIRLDENKGISKFWLEIAEGASQPKVEDQGGVGFAIQDTVMLANSTCFYPDNMIAQVNIAVRSIKLLYAA